MTYTLTSYPGIFRVDTHQAILCKHCRLLAEVPRIDYGDPDTLLRTIETFAKNHQVCAMKPLARA